MTIALTLLLLRVLSASILLVLLGALFWVILHDFRATVQNVTASRKIYGYLVGLTRINDEYGQTGEVFPMLPLTTLGRAPTNTVRINDAFASSEHATITLRNGVWWLEDNNSRNGTQLNQMTIQQPVIITDNDIVSIGNQHFRIELEA